MSELERLEAELTALQGTLADSTHRERSSAAQLAAESAAASALSARIAALRSEVPPGAPPVGTLTGTGHWEPLALGPNANASSEPPLELQPEADLAAISKFLAQVVMKPHLGKDDLPTLIKLRDRYAHEPTMRRLLAATFFSIGRNKQAQELDPTINPGAVIIDSPRVHVPWLTGALELPSEHDGVTDVQRTLIGLIEQHAPASRAAVPISLIERESGIDPDRVQTSLLALAHPALRPLPIVELFGFAGPFRNHDTRIERVRMGAWPDWRELPLLLINGFAGRGSCAPPREPARITGLLIDRLISAQRDVMHLGRPKFPGSDAHVSGWNSATDNHDRVLTHARLEADATPRVVISSLPWPLRPAEVKAELEDRRIDGVVTIVDESDAQTSRLVVLVEHVSFANLVRNRLRHAGTLGLRWAFSNVLGDGRVASLGTRIEWWLERRLEQMSKSGPDVVPLDQRAAELEALYLGRSMLEPLQAALREALDDTEAIAVLVRYFETRDRTPLTALMHRSHDYERGFTEAQARFLVKVRKLHAHRLETIGNDWKSALARCDDARAATQSREQLRSALHARLLEFDRRVKSLK